MRKTVLLFAAFMMWGVVSFAQGKLTVTSTAFKENGMIPTKYSCMGQEVSPPLAFGGVPQGTKTLAIIVHDPDAPVAGGFTHWVIWNIDPASPWVPEGFTSIYQGLNGARTRGYKGMCPPTGTHHYHFMVYALDVQLNLNRETTDKKALEKVMKGHILASGDLVGTFDKAYK